ncbi:MAG TPA: ABC transporter permease [Terriglobales bacterium]|nr:ABC transporter permease [Terriglobales bacterium]
MPDWKQYVRENLRLKGVQAEREAEVVEDLAQQLEDAYGEALARGSSDKEAAREAQQHIPDWAKLRRDLQGSPRLAIPALRRMDDRVGDAAASGNRIAALFTGLSRDLAFALRMIRNNPGFTFVAVFTLALGIGANTTIFSWTNAILLNPLPGIQDAGRMTEVITLSKSEFFTSMSYPDYLDYRQQATTLAGIAVHDMDTGALDTPRGAQRIWVELASDNFFDMLGVHPILGRTFVEAEGKSPVPVVVISERLWRNRLGADPDIIGKKLDINRMPFTVIGVVPKEFISGYTGLAMDVWAPVQMAETFIAGPNRLPNRGNQWLNTLARLKPGVTPAQAAEELSAIAQRIDRGPNAAQNRVGVFPLWRSPRGAQAVLGPVLLVLMAVVGVILLITCANIANLLLSRAVARRREFAVRLSIGCSRMRLMRQMVTETMLLVTLAAAGALVAQRWTAGLLLRFIPPSDLPITLVTGLDLRILGFTAALALASALFFGIVPAWQAGRTELATALKNDSAQGGTRRAWLRNTLVVSQLALSLLLLISAGLFVRSLQQAKLFDPGFRADHLLLSQVDLFSAGYDKARGQQALERMLSGIRNLPGVESASMARRVPLSLAGGSSSSTIEPEGYEAPKGTKAWSYFNTVAPQYFQTMRIPVLRGREFSASDRPDAPEGFMINQTFAERYWPGQDPIGKRIRYGRNWYPVIGMVADSKYRKLNEPASPFVYLSTTWNYVPAVIFHVRTATDPRAVAAPLRSVVAQVDPKLPVYGVSTMEETIQAASFQQRLSASLLGAFGLLAVVLASVGLYASMAYSVSRRTRELGVRMALGASRRDVGRLVLGNALRLTGVGVAIGLLLAAGATRLFASLLFGVSAGDPAIFGGVVALLAAIALIAAYLPARRAAQLDPLQALRCE